MKTLKTLIRLALWQGVSLLLLLYTGTRLPKSAPSPSLPSSQFPFARRSLSEGGQSPQTQRPPLINELSNNEEKIPQSNEPTNNESTIPRSNDPATPDPRCIIIVDGGRYDVTTFRNIHSGGDVFTCGADLSALFHTQHDAETLEKFQVYRIN